MAAQCLLAGAALGAVRNEGVGRFDGRFDAAIVVRQLFR